MGSDIGGSDGSSSLTEDAINLSFDDIEYIASNGLCAGGRKAILRGLSGTFNAGELTVLIGQSGAGKSTLMDILACYRKPTNGCIYVNGRLRDDKWFRRRSCYIMQDDNLKGMLTVQESLNVAANLKLGEHVSKVQKQRRIEEILMALGLKVVRHTRAGNLSGGQKKRLAIGLELVSDPPVIFLDEPISGLDSSISKQLVYLFHQLSRQGRTVVVTLHQPSAALLQMVDRLYGVVAGRCAYSGSVSMLVSYLENLNLKCPQFHDPVDFFIEASTQHTDLLVESSDNGKNTQWITDIPADNDKGNPMFQRNLSIYEEISLTALPPPKEDETSKILLKLKSTYSTSSWRQFCTLSRRCLLITWRDPAHTYLVIGIHFLVALFIGSLFFNIGEDAQYIRDNYNFLYFSLMFNMFTAFSSVSVYFPQELPVIRREHFNRWYSAGPYYAATLFSGLPKQLACSFIYASITFLMTGQPHNVIRFSGFCFMLIFVSYVALLLGLLNGSIFSTKNGVIFGPFIIMPFTIFSGFFLRYTDAPYFFRWMFQVSFLKHGLVGLLLTIFGMDRQKLPCSALYCHYSYPKQFLKDNGCESESYVMSIVALCGISSFLIASSFIILKLRLKFKW